MAPHRLKWYRGSQFDPTNSSCIVEAILSAIGANWTKPFQDDVAQSDNLNLCLVPKNTKKIKNIYIKKNDFLIFNYPLKNIKENQI